MMECAGPLVVPDSFYRLTFPCQSRAKSSCTSWYISVDKKVNLEMFKIYLLFLIVIFIQLAKPRALLIILNLEFYEKDKFERVSKKSSVISI